VKLESLNPLLRLKAAAAPLGSSWVRFPHNISKC